MDAWRQSEFIDKEIINSTQKRLAYTVRRASRAMAVTSSTTAAAFSANYLSPIMPIRSASLFGTIVIPMNYFLVVVIFSPAVIFYEKNIKTLPTLRSVSKIFIKDDVQAASTQYRGVFGKIEKYFEETWTQLIFNLRYYVFGVTSLWLIFAFYHAIKIGPLTEPEKFLNEDHRFEAGNLAI